MSNWGSDWAHRMSYIWKDSGTGDFKLCQTYYAPNGVKTFI